MFPKKLTLFKITQARVWKSEAFKPTHGSKLSSSLKLSTLMDLKSKQRRRVQEILLKT